MTSVREQLEEQRAAMAPEIQALLDVSDEGIGHVVEFSARWGVALRAVLDRHDEFKIYDECGHRHHRDGDPGVLSIENVGLTCEDGYEYSICRECCTGGSGEYQTEECASHDHDNCWPCVNVQDIAAALTPKEGQ